MHELLSVDAFVHLGGGILRLLSGSRIIESKMYNLVPHCKSVIGNCTIWWWYRSIRGNRCCLGGLLSQQYLSLHSQTGLVPRYSVVANLLALVSGICSSVAWQHGSMAAWWHHSGHSRIGHSHWSVMPTLVRSPTSRTSRPFKNGLRYQWDWFTSIRTTKRHKRTL